MRIARLCARPLSTAMHLAREIRDEGLAATFDRRWPDAFLLGTHAYFLIVAAFLGRVDLFAFGAAAAVGSWGMFRWVRS